MMIGRLKDRQALTLDQIGRMAPSVFAETPHHEVTNKYVFIPTYKALIEPLMKEGWQVVSAGEHRVRSASKQCFQKHMLRFTHPNLPMIGDSILDLVAFNSHDRTTGFQFSAGLWRQVCSNGLHVCDDLFQKISVKHVGNNAQDAIEASFKVIDALPRIAESVDAMRSMQLSTSEKEAFAVSATIARYGTPALPSENPMNKPTLPINPLALLRPRRHEERNASDLWTTFNVVQENLVKGGVRTVNQERTKRVTIRGVKSISEDAKLNAALWQLAESMKMLKAA